MILVDTNVASEPLKPVPSALVQAWLRQQDTADLHFSAVSKAEVLFGLECMPQGLRRQSLEARFWQLTSELFAYRILPFDDRAAIHFARLMAHARRAGHPVSIPDAQIAAIAAAHGLTVATRDTAPFRAMGVPVIDPWHHPA